MRFSDQEAVYMFDSEHFPVWTFELVLLGNALGRIPIELVRYDPDPHLTSPFQGEEFGGANLLLPLQGGGWEGVEVRFYVTGKCSRARP